MFFVGHTEEDIKKHLLNHMLDIFNPQHYREFEGDLIPTRVKQIEKQRELETERRKQRQLEYERKMEEQRSQEREMLRKKRQKEQEQPKIVSNDSKIMDLDYENLEFQPDMMEEPKEPKVVEKSSENEQVMIKKQSKDEASEVLQEVKSTVLQTLNEIVQNVLPSQPSKVNKKFDADEFYQRLKVDAKYTLNSSWNDNFAVMSCPAQRFIERFSIQGEFFENYD